VSGIFVFGASRPGFPSTHVENEDVTTWINFVKSQGVSRVCCLLDQPQRAYYGGLILHYEHSFGANNVCAAPIADYHLADEHVLKNHILPFLTHAQHQKINTVVHCSAGIGRTGHVIAAWLVYYFGLSNSAALYATSEMGFNANESSKNVGSLLDRVRMWHS
jgi:protein-tyrosine phosphatase